MDPVVWLREKYEIPENAKSPIELPDCNRADLAERPPSAFVYVVTNNVNGKRYVGQTHLTIQERWSRSPETLRKLSDSAKALWASSGYRARMSAAHAGKPWSSAQRAAREK